MINKSESAPANNLCRLILTLEKNRDLVVSSYCISIFLSCKGREKKRINTNSLEVEHEAAKRERHRPRSAPGCSGEPRRGARRPPQNPRCCRPGTSWRCWCRVYRWSPTDVPPRPAPASCTSPVQTGKDSSGLADLMVHPEPYGSGTHRSVAEAHGAGFAFPQVHKVAFSVLEGAADPVSIPTADFTGRVCF